MLLSRNFVKMLRGYQKATAKELLEKMKECEEAHIAYPVAIRIFANMSKSELFVVRELINQLGANNELTFSHHDIARKLFVSDTVVYEAVRVLNVAGVVFSKGIGNRKSHLVALNKDALQELLEIINTFLER